MPQESVNGSIQTITGAGVSGLVGSELFRSNALQSLIAAVSVYILMLLAFRLIDRRIADINRRHSAKKLTRYIAHLVLLSALAIIWSETYREQVSLSFIIGVSGAGLIVAMQDILVSFIGWLYTLVATPYQIGDRVEIGGVKGDVIDIRFLHTQLLEVSNWTEGEQSTLRITNVPNRNIFTQPFHNYTSGGFEYIWNELPVVVTFESDWQKAKELMLKIAEKDSERMQENVSKALKRIRKRYPIYYGKLTPIVYVTIVDNGIKLTLRYLTHVRRRRSTLHELSQQILLAFEEHDEITFAYPTYRIVR